MRGTRFWGSQPVPNLLADMRRSPNGSQALSLLFRSAEAYLETWQRAYSHR